MRPGDNGVPAAEAGLLPAPMGPGAGELGDYGS